MSGEKKHWRLSTPFQRFSGTQESRLKARVGRSGSRVSSVYLSDDSSTSGFVIVPEFDCPAQTRTAHEEPSRTSQLPVVTSSGPSSSNAINSRPINFEPTCSRNSYLDGRSCDVFTPDKSPSWDDLARRLDVAYEHIRSMPSEASPKALLPSDPRMLRKQLGVPQHSVFNHPIHSSLDLPNPHGSPPEPTSPRLSPPARARHIQDSVHPAQSKSPTENALLRSGPPGMLCTAEIACTSKNQALDLNSSNLGKRRIGETTFSSSSLPSSGRQALRRVLRRSGADTPPSASALPQIRSPSPFKVDIPLHHAWHERRTDFNYPARYNRTTVQCLETNSRRTSGSTEILASLAWVGTPSGSQRCCPANPAFFEDHFSMAVAVEDESISDDVLVDQLEEARRIVGAFSPARDASPSRSSSNAHSLSTGHENTFSPASSPPSSLPTSDQLANKPCDATFPSPQTSKDKTDSEDAVIWKAARKALLCIREIIRTEKKYQEALKMLLNAETATPPPPSMVPYVSALIHVSDTLLLRFLEDPSAWGVSTAFVTSEDELETTMVSWSAVAGAYFMDRSDSPPSKSFGRKRLRKPGPTSKPSSPMTSQSPFTVTASKIKERTAGEDCTGKHLQTDGERQTAPVPLSVQRPESTNNQGLTGHPPSRKLSVRDLAIQPIQRVVRYVLLYRDLLDCTPVMSPPRLLVERALEAATRIANHCDRAQRNPAFYYGS